VDLRSHVSGVPLKSTYARGFVYSDGWVQDARLVVLNAMDARRLGADVRVRTRCISAHVEDGAWQAQLLGDDGQVRSCRAKVLINACGPWAGRFLGDVLGRDRHPRVRLVKGSHIVLPRLFEHDHAYIFQQPDRRIVFAIPYEDDYTLVGTTDLDYAGDPANVVIDAGEIRYLCDAVNRYFRTPVQPADVAWSYSGVRPLLDEDGSASAVSRDYRITLDHEQGAPLLNVFGGKITTYRRLAEEAVDQLTEVLQPERTAWTADGDPLPGGDFADAERLLAAWSQRWPWLPSALARRWLRHYGTCTETLLGGARTVGDLGEHFGAGLYQLELDYLIRAEWARSGDDVLWRRTKLGLRLNPEQRDRVQACVARMVPLLVGAAVEGTEARSA
jgi:glycerol-3-phosphate dehydrogenase